MSLVGCDTRHRVLIADDDLVVQATLNASLGSAFDVVGVAGNSELAIELAAACQPDAALVDVDMPGGGLRAVRGILEVAPATAVVMLSSDESDQGVRELMTAGAMAYCRKGVGSDVLADLLTRSIEVRVSDRTAQV
jgi:DNA-binding NarL/FixJ family response regulator